jgi:hypothetical protein
VGIVIVVSCSKYDEGFISSQCVQYLSSIKLELSNNEVTLCYIPKLSLASADSLSICAMSSF